MVLARYLIGEEIEELWILVEILVDIGLESVRGELVLSCTGLTRRVSMRKMSCSGREGERGERRTELAMSLVMRMALQFSFSEEERMLSKYLTPSRIARSL
jgi:hypothetical protein